MKAEPLIAINVSTQLLRKIGKPLLILVPISFIMIFTIYYKPYLSIPAIYILSLSTSLLVPRFYTNLKHKYILAPLAINAVVGFIATEQAKQIADIAVSYQAIKKVFFIVCSNFVLSVVLTKLYVKKNKG